MSIFSVFSSEKKRLKKLDQMAQQVMSLEQIYKDKTDEQLIECTSVLKKRLENGETLNDILFDAFAVVREASARVLNMRHFKVQIMGGIALHQGRIAEMKTGEGKTLVATLPAYLNALSGKGVHIVTVNEYLARRDAEWMGKVYKFLGLTVGVSVSGMDDNKKRDAYNCDITYCTNNELGFDYLRDNMVVKKSQRVQRGQSFAIIDEVDSILIDEARTPLIISGRGMKSSENYYSAQRFATVLKNEEDYEIELKQKTIHLTEKGSEKAEKYFRVENLSDVANIELNHYIMNALKANYIMKRDENYIVKDDEILIVDEFTGRLMQGRRFSDGLHQAIEAKENVKIKDENKTLATVTFQNYFRLYSKLSGMTGTAKTEELEFNSIYNVDVICIPPNKPVQRIDAHDVIYRTENGKIMAVVEEIKERSEKGQPILVGTVNIDKSEQLSEELRKAKIRHNVLNAKNHEQESEIIAQAGRFGSVTIATNMAGRGTDILLGGNPEFMAKKKMKEENFEDEEISFATSFVTSSDEKMIHARDVYKKYYDEFKSVTDAEKEKVINAGGLHIIGTERHESRRIDNQLRGRSGRQGDKGSSIFFLSLEDDLMMRFGGERLQKIADFLKIDDSTPLQMRILSHQIENAQKKIEQQNFAIRKSVLRFDDVMSKQRQIIYGERNKVIDGLDVHEQIVEMIPDVVAKVCNTYLDSDKPYFQWDISSLNNGLEDKLFPKGTNLITEQMIEDCDVSDVVNKVVEIINEKYTNNIEITKQYNINFADFERFILLRVVDSLWMDHIDQMQILRNEIGLQAYAQRDPVVEYKRQGFEMFDNMVEKIQEDTVSYIINTKIEINRVQPTEESKGPQIPKVQTTNINPGTIKSEKTIGRNDICSCGSGKKYKNCCGKNN